MHPFQDKNYINKTSYILQYAVDTALVVYDKTTSKDAERHQKLSNKKMTWF